MTIAHDVAHPVWCARTLCSTGLVDVTHAEVGDLLVPALEPSSPVSLGRVRVNDDATDIVLRVGDTSAPLTRQDARDLARLLTRYANDATT